MPSHYVWTPRGYVFAEGHWDYSLERRGVLFAPVYFPRSVYERAGFSYSPSIVIDIGMLQVSLFTYPRYSHYYFGDYYDDAYLRIGIYPRFESERSHTWYDPIYEYDRWQNRRTEPRWEEHERHEYDLRRADKDLRPARTYREMETRLAKLPEPQRRDLQMARPLTAVVAAKATPLKLRADQQRHTKEDRHAGDRRAEVPRGAQPLGVHGDGAEDSPTTHGTQRPCDATDRAQGAGAHTRGGQEFGESTPGAHAAIRFAACGPGDQAGDGEDPQAADHRQAGQFG